MSLYNSTLDQPFVFAAFLYVGILTGALLSAVRLIAGLFGRGRGVRIAAEAVFLPLAAAGMFFALYRFTGLRLRGYHFLGAGAGFGLYRAAVRPLAVWMRKKFTKKEIDNPPDE